MSQQNDLMNGGPPNKDKIDSHAEGLLENDISNSNDSKSILSDKAEKDEEIQQLSLNGSRDNYIVGVVFLIFLGVSMLISGAFYHLAHGNNLIQIFTNPKIAFKVDFIGNERNAFAVACEVVFWTAWGVSCRMAYAALIAMKEGKFRFWRQTAICIGTMGFAWGVGVALIFSLSLISLTIGKTKITLDDISLETIITISFIIGFYNEQALTLLERVRDKFTGRIKSESPTNKP